jgi:hypothetical protein
VFFSLIISIDISPLGFERSLAYMLLVEEHIIISMLDDLKIEKPQYQYKKQKSEETEQIKIFAHFDIFQKRPGLQPIF